MAILPPLNLPTQGGSNPINTQGPPGPQGPAGANGSDGADGATGPQGPAGPENPLAMSGDMDGYTDSNQLVSIQGVPISMSSPADGDVLTYSALGNSLSLQPPSGGGTLGGDVTGSATSNTVQFIQGRFVNLATLFDGGVLTYSNDTGSITLQQPFQSTILYCSLSGPITNPNTGDIVQFNVLGTGPGTYLSTGLPGQFALVFTGSGPNVSFKLTASMGSLYDGNFTYQWWDVNRNIGLGNVAGNVGGGPSQDAVAVIPYSYASTTIAVVLKLTFVNGTTFIGENTAGGFILPWATLETFGIPQDVGG